MALTYDLDDFGDCFTVTICDKCRVEKPATQVSTEGYDSFVEEFIHLCEECLPHKEKFLLNPPLDFVTSGCCDCGSFTWQCICGPTAEEIAEEEAAAAAREDAEDKFLNRAITGKPVSCRSFGYQPPVFS